MAITFGSLQSASDGANATTYTFSSQNLGDADTDRHIIVGISTRDVGTTSQAISSVSIGGVSATIVVQQRNSATNTCVAGLAIAKVPTGTTGDIVVTFSEEVLRCGIGVWRAIGISATATDTGSSTSNNPSDSINISAGVYERIINVAKGKMVLRNEVFNECISDVFRLMASNSWPRFRESDLYKNQLLQTHVEPDVNSKPKKNGIPVSQLFCVCHIP